MTDEQRERALTHVWKKVTRIGDYSMWRCKACSLRVQTCDRGLGSRPPVGNLHNDDVQFTCDERRVSQVMES